MSYFNKLEWFSRLADKAGQNESGRRLFLAAALALALSRLQPAEAQMAGGLNTGGLTFRDFAKADNGASFNRGDSMPPAGSPNPTNARIVSIDKENGLARIQFSSLKVELSLPLGWQATEDSERGVAFSADRAYRVIVWRLDFAFEGVQDAEQYTSAKIGAIQSRRRGVQAKTRKLDDSTYLVIYEGVPPNSSGDSSSRTVFDLIMTKPGEPKQGVLLTLGVPASDADRGQKLLALLKEKLSIIW
jgi:hypothetical protein